MSFYRRAQHYSRIVNILLIACGSAGLAACTSASNSVTIVERQNRVAETSQFLATAQPAPAAIWSPQIAAAEQPARRGRGYKLGKPYQMGGNWYKPVEDASYDRVGSASWYGGMFHGRLTANGEVFDAMALTAAHPTLPLPSYVRVTNLENSRSIVVRVNDRGPYAYKRLIDVSQRTAELLGFKRDGKAQVRVQYVDRARLDGNDQEFLLASYRGPGADLWSGADASVASAEPRPRRVSAPKSPVQLAALAPAAPKPRAAPQPAPVAFASADASMAAEVAAFEAVTTAYDPGTRISMAFEMASQAEH